MNILSKYLFYIISFIGRRFGGIPPRRFTHWLGKKAFNGPKKTVVNSRWYTDTWGNSFFLNPAFHIDRYIIAFGCYDFTLHKFIDRHVQPDMTCFDIGANTGTVAIHLASKVGKGGKVYCFEPVPHIYDTLTMHVEENNKNNVCITSKLALSESSGIATISVADETSENQGLGSLVHHGHPNLVKQIKISCETIDEFVNSNHIEQVDFMKIDIQGGEVYLLRGGQEFFAADNAPDLMIEISPEDLQSIDLNSRDLLALLESYKYYVFAVKEDGTVGESIESQYVDANFSSPNVFCTKRDETGHISV